MVPISVVIPVGPRPEHFQWLGEMLISIANQTLSPNEVILISDGVPRGNYPWYETLRKESYQGDFKIWNNPWCVGPSDCMNFGVGLAKNELVLMACADDKLLPKCVEHCWSAWQKYDNPLGYYYLGVQYSNGDEQNTACGAAMVTKALWDYTGGFPPHCAVGAADHIFLSALIAGSNHEYSKAQILRVNDELTYWYRQHDNTETSRNVWPAIEAVRDWFTATWRPKQ